MHVLEAALVAHLMDSPRRALADHADVSEQSVQRQPEWAMADPSRRGQIAEPSLIRRFCHWLAPRNRLPARSVG
jgi:hypothetical protein